MDGLCVCYPRRVGRWERVCGCAGAGAQCVVDCALGTQRRAVDITDGRSMADVHNDGVMFDGW